MDLSLATYRSRLLRVVETVISDARAQHEDETSRLTKGSAV